MATARSNRTSQRPDSRHRSSRGLHRKQHLRRLLLESLERRELLAANILFDFSDAAGDPDAEGWTSSGPANEWHLSTGRGNDPGHSADDSFYFGSGEDAAGNGLYSNNADGTLTSPSIDLTTAAAALLKFNHYLEVESGFDFATISVIHSGGTDMLATSGDDLPNATVGFEQAIIDLSAYVGDSIQIAFRLTTDISARREGWYIDDVVIEEPAPIIGQFDFSDDVGDPDAEGFTLTGDLWHLSTGRGNDPGHSADDSFYFGAGEDTFGGGLYTNNADGTITSPPIDLSNAVSAALSFNHFLEAENLFDFATVGVIDTSGTTVIATSGNQLPVTTNGFEAVELDLSPFVGDTIQIAFRFTTDGSVRFEGWYVDDVTIIATEFDYGDAPDVSGGTGAGDYSTLLSNDGPRHVISGPRLGAMVDAETDGQPSVLADGDDLGDDDDEDGVVFTSTLFAGGTGTVDVTVMQADGRVNGWIDFNQDGQFGIDEQIVDAQLIVSGTTETISFPIPVAASTGTTYTRFRVSSAGALGPLGPAADGEVEDYRVTIDGLDFGDAPAPYPTLLADDGARHEVVGPTLGIERDHDGDGLPDPLALGDDNDNVPDESGVTISGPLTASLTAAVTGSVDVDLQNADPTSNRLDAWIDFNRDGDWNDAGEQVFTDFDLGTADGVQTLSFTIPQDDGTNIQAGPAFSRWRLSTAGGLGVTGLAADGEVEDHVVDILRGPVEIDPFADSVMQIVITDGFDQYHVPLRGTSTVEVFFEGDVEGAATDNDGDGFDEVVTELVQADYVGFHPHLGAVELHLRNDIRSLGLITETVNATPGLLDLDPFAPGDANSFFDVWLEVQLIDQGVTLTTHVPTRLASFINDKPPHDGERYRFDFGSGPVELFDENDNPTGFFIVNEVHDPVPMVEHDLFERTIGQLVIDLPGVGTELITAAGQTSVDVYFEGPAEGDAEDDDNDGLDEVVTELVQADFAGFHPLLGPVEIRLRDDLPSLGRIIEQFNDNPGLLDLDPFAPGNADSFFDVYFEIFLPATGQTLITVAPTRLESVIDDKSPEDGERYLFDPPQPVELIDQATGLGTGIFLVREVHDVAPTVEEDVFPDMKAVVELTGGEFGVGTPLLLRGDRTEHVYFEGPFEGEASDDDFNGLDEVVSEIVDLSLTDGTVTIMIDPTRPSLGRITEQVNNNPGLLDVDHFAPGDAESFFDVFFQIDTGDGQILHNQQPVRIEAVIQHKPDADAAFVAVIPPAGIELFDEDGNATGIFIASARYELLNPFQRLEPLGSLISVSSDSTGNLPDAGDTQDFNLFLEAGETLAAELGVDAGVTGTIEIVELSASASSSAPGAEAVLPSVTIPDDGVYTVRVSADMATSFSLDLFRNTSLESLVGDTADGNELAIDESLLVLGAAAGRFASFGTSLPVEEVLSTQQVLYGIQSSTGLIVQVDPATGDVVRSFPLPEATATEIAGLSGAEGGSTLIYQSSEVNSENLFRLSPVDGSVLSTEFMDASPFRGGLSYQDGSIFAIDNGGPVDVQDGFGGPVTDHLSTLSPDIPGSLGGDDFGRHFVLASGEIQEFDPLVADSILNSFLAPGTISGLAFDGVNLYASELNTGELFTINPDTGAVLDTNTVQGGTLIGLGVALGTQLIDVDEYTIDLTGKSGQPIDVLLSGVEGADFRAEVLELIDVDGSTVLAAATSDPLGVEADNYDLGILDFVVPADGVYTVRLTSLVPGDYSIVVTDPLTFESELNADPAVDPLRDVTDARTALGFLDEQSDMVDHYAVTMAAGETLTVSAEALLATFLADPQNTLDVSLSVIHPDGSTVVATDQNTLDGKNPILSLIAPTTGVYTIAVAAESGIGEYLVQLSDANFDPIITQTDGSTDVSEDGSVTDTYEVVLGAVPIADVTVTITPDAQVDVGGGPATPIELTFTPADWNIPQTVNVSAFDDTVAEAISHPGIVTHTISSTDPDFDGNTADLTVNVTDDDFLTPVITSTAADPTNLAAIPISVSFGAAVTQFDDTDLTVVGGTVGNFSDDGGGVFSFQITPDADGTITVDIAAAAALDASDKETLAATQFTIDSDQTAPTTVITGPAGPINSEPFNVTITFSEIVSDFVLAEVVVGNGSATGLFDNSDGTFTATIDPTADGSVTVDVAANVATDSADNGNTAAAQYSIVFDTTAPTPVITGPSSPSNSDPFAVTINFGEIATGFEAADISVGGGSVTNLTDNNDGTFFATIDPAADGNITVDVAAGGANDLAGNANLAATQFVVTIDTAAPTPAVTGPASPTNSDPFQVTISFGETVTGFADTDITVANGSVAALVDNNDGTFTATIDASSDTTVRVDIAAGVANDTAGNANLVADQFSVVVDTAGPTPLITGPTSPTNSDPFQVTINFGELVTGFESADVTVAGGSLTNLVDNSDGSFTATIDAIADGNVTIDIAAAAATDTAGNTSLPAVQFAVVVDTTAPTPTITGPNSPTNSPSFDVTIDFGELVGGFIQAEVSVAGGSVRAFSNDGGRSFTATIAAPADGTVTIDVAAGVASDSAGNANNAAAQLSIVVDTTAPAIGVPDDLIVDANLAAGAEKTLASVAAFLSAVTATDEGDPDPTITNDAPDIFPAGETTVTFTATDALGNQQTATALVTVNFDYGDAPDASDTSFANSYPVTLAQDGARHAPGSLVLGSVIDSEADGQPHIVAGVDGSGGDDGNGDPDDEDGVVAAATAVAVVDVETTSSFRVTTSEDGKLDAWIDFDRNGLWDADEQIIDSIDVFTGVNIMSYTIPADAVIGGTGVRFRLSSSGDLDPTGAAADGEVEDYVALIEDGSSEPAITVDLGDDDTTVITIDEYIVVGGGGGIVLFSIPINNFGPLDLSAGDGDNTITLDGLGGSAIPPSGLNLDGGGGSNMLRLTGGQSGLDFTAAGNGTAQNFSTLDLSDSAPQNVTLDAASVLALAPNGRLLVIGGLNPDNMIEDPITMQKQDSITLADADDWRMGETSFVDGKFIRRVTNVAGSGAEFDSDSAQPWQNVVKFGDVNNNGRVTAGDANIIITELGQRLYSDRETSVLRAPADVENWPNFYYDHTGDNRATALDALRVINDLARIANTEGSAGEAETVALVAQQNPEEEATDVPPAAAPTVLQEANERSQIAAILPTEVVDAVLAEVGTENSASKDSDGSRVDQIIELLF